MNAQDIQKDESFDHLVYYQPIKFPRVMEKRARRESIKFKRKMRREVKKYNRKMAKGLARVLKQGGG